MKKNILAILTGLLLITSFAPQVQAALSSISLSPSTRTIAANNPAVVPVTWTVMRNGAAGSVTVDSPSVIIRLGNSNGPILITISKALSKTQNIVNNVTPYIFSEAINIPRSVVYTATKAGQPLLIQRIFTDQSDAQVITGEMPVNIGGSGSEFSVSRITLTFDDGSSSCSVPDGKKRTALAQITASGTGILRGAWQVRTGGGLGSYRTLRTVNVPVSGNTVIQSPALPSTNAGERMEVRLAVESPVTNFGIPSITCGSMGGSSLLKYSEKDLKLTKVISPAVNSPLNSDTVLKWEAFKGAKSYRIEILADENGEPITAQLAKPTETSAKLSPLTLDKLKTNGRYTVRVVIEE